jgi:hypothetical protein
VRVKKGKMNRNNRMNREKWQMFEGASKDISGTGFMRKVI